MSRTNIDIDDELIAEVMEFLGLPTKRSAVEHALREVLARRATAESVLAAAGAGFDLDNDALESDDSAELADELASLGEPPARTA